MTTAVAAAAPGPRGLGNHGFDLAGLAENDAEADEPQVELLNPRPEPRHPTLDPKYRRMRWSWTLRAGGVMGFAGRQDAGAATRGEPTVKAKPDYRDLFGTGTMGLLELEWRFQPWLSFSLGFTNAIFRGETKLAHWGDLSHSNGTPTYVEYDDLRMRGALLGAAFHPLQWSYRGSAAVAPDGLDPFFGLRVAFTRTEKLKATVRAGTAPNPAFDPVNAPTQPQFLPPNVTPGQQIEYWDERPGTALWPTLGFSYRIRNVALTVEGGWWRSAGAPKTGMPVAADAKALTFLSLAIVISYTF